MGVEVGGDEVVFRCGGMQVWRENLPVCLLVYRVLVEFSLT